MKEKKYFAKNKNFFNRFTRHMKEKQKSINDFNSLVKLLGIFLWKK